MLPRHVFDRGRDECLELEAENHTTKHAQNI